MPRKKKIEQPINTEENQNPLLKKKRKKKENPHKRAYGIEIIQNKNCEPIRHKISIDIGFRTSGLCHFDCTKGTLQSIHYKKSEDCQVQGMKILNLVNLCYETLTKYMELLPKEVVSNLPYTQFILEEPLVIMGQKSFSITLYVFLSVLITRLIEDYDVHSVVLVTPGSAKRLLGYKSNVKMPDSKKTEFCKDHLPEVGVKNNHCADAVFSMVLTNQDELKRLYPCLNLLTNVEYETYYSRVENFRTII